jgi:hypothetical protein
MKQFKKLLFTSLIVLFLFSALSFLATSVEAQSTVNYQATISADTSNVDQDAAYTFDVANTGVDTIGYINVTIPAGYASVKNMVITQKPGSQTWNISLQDDRYIVLQSAEGLGAGESITFGFDITNPLVAGTYVWRIGASIDGLTSPEVLDVTYVILVASILPALAILGIAVGIAFLNSGIYRFMINHFIGWEQYHIMQKEMAEHRSQTMAAMRANDKKQIEKLKRKDSQIKNMQAKMAKPQMAQFGFSFVYIAMWFLVLTPTFGSTSMAFVPGFGPIPVFWWYPICSVFFGLVSQRIVGIMPIEH